MRVGSHYSASSSASAAKLGWSLSASMMAAGSSFGPANSGAAPALATTSPCAPAPYAPSHAAESSVRNGVAGGSNSASACSSVTQPSACRSAAARLGARLCRRYRCEKAERSSSGSLSALAAVATTSTRAPGSIGGCRSHRASAARAAEAPSPLTSRSTSSKSTRARPPEECAAANASAISRAAASPEPGRTTRATEKPFDSAEAARALFPVPGLPVTSTDVSEAA
mmetsp:Transcript_28058/g.91720  ORF Transcript_28058/g.91720 Transcript_28058/m.91720 type:complete len:226 (-) Transcript_28058:1263-1940(-)